MTTTQVNNTSDVAAFFIELVKRFASKSPKFFQVINWVTGTCTLLLGVPAFLETINIYMQWHLALPAWFDDIKHASIALITFGMWLTSKLSVQRSVVVNVDKAGLPAGTVAGATHEDLPFTAKKEEKVTASK